MLSRFEIETNKKITKKHFEDNANVCLIGSRVLEEKKVGDIEDAFINKYIDFYGEFKKHAYSIGVNQLLIKKLSFYSDKT